MNELAYNTRGGRWATVRVHDRVAVSGQEFNVERIKADGTVYLRSYTDGKTRTVRPESIERVVA